MGQLFSTTDATTSWTHEQYPFCESIQNNGALPEYINTITSISYLLSFILGCLYSSVDYFTIGKILQSSLVPLALGSALFHATLWTLFGNLDVFSMLFLSFYGSLFALDTTLLHFGQKKDIIYSLSTMGFLLAVSIQSIQYNGMSLILLVGGPQCITLLCIILLVIFTPMTRAIKYMIIAELCFIIIGVGESYVEATCIREPGWSREFIGSHGIWHVCTAYSTHLLLHAFTYIRGNLGGNRASFKDGWFFLIFPCVNVNREDEL